MFLPPEYPFLISRYYPVLKIRSQMVASVKLLSSVPQCWIFPGGCWHRREIPGWSTLAQKKLPRSIVKKKHKWYVSGREKAPGLGSSSCCKVRKPAWALRKDVSLCGDARHFGWCGFKRGEENIDSISNLHECPFNTAIYLSLTS